MYVQLDEEIWEVNDRVQLGEVLANLSDRAQAKGCLVTELMVGNQTMTDRELVPPTLAQVASSFGSIAAVSKRLETIVQYSEKTGGKFGQQLHLQAQKFVDDFRQGHGIFRQLDQWFGQMADYLEWLQIHESVGHKKPEIAQDLSLWVNELMNAREIEDEVRIADMLEYEVLPRLSRNFTSPM
jgi:secreted PhoX family phosphatase